MADLLPPLEMDFNDTGTPVVIVAEAEAETLADTLRLAPALSDPQWLRAYTRVANHLAGGDEYEPIMDPEAFKAEYMAAYNAEDPDEEVGPGVVRLHGFGIPDFDAIKPPAREGETLIFFAKQTFMGIPYKATMAPGEDPVYEPVAMVE